MSGELQYSEAAGPSGLNNKSFEYQSEEESSVRKSISEAIPQGHLVGSSACSSIGFSALTFPEIDLSSAEAKVQQLALELAETTQSVTNFRKSFGIKSLVESLGKSDSESIVKADINQNTMSVNMNRFDNFDVDDDAQSTSGLQSEVQEIDFSQISDSAMNKFIEGVSDEIASNIDNYKDFILGVQFKGFDATVIVKSLMANGATH